MPVSHEEALRRGEDALANDAPEEALAWAERALTTSPRAPEALELKAVALAELGALDAAEATLDRLIELEPHEPRHLVAAADVRIRGADEARAPLEEALEHLDAADELADEDPELTAEIALLKGLALNQLGACAEALRELDRVLAAEPEHPEARLERALALFELGRFGEAQGALEVLVREHPDEPWAHHYLGLIAERRGGDAAAHFERARALDPEALPPPVSLSAEAFDAAVAEALDALPAHARPALDNVVVRAELLPSDEDVREGLSPTILGVFQGTPLDERSPIDAAHHQTARIALFQRNLERFARTRDELIEEIRVTVLHEVGHLLGLDEDELAERGLD
jgi:predicted Zn-dependent protease with MMP-like domain/Flp pilus assembly protein TadD